MEIAIENSTHIKKVPGSHSSYWAESEETLLLTKLRENIKTDVVIVGGGIAGVTIAYCLLRSGKKVALIDDGEIGSGETGRTTAQLVTTLDERYYKLEKKFGKRKTKLIAQNHVKAIDFIEKVIQNEGKVINGPANTNLDYYKMNGSDIFLHGSPKKENHEVH